MMWIVNSNSWDEWNINAMFMPQTRMQRLSFRPCSQNESPKTILLSPCWELSIEAVKWQEALFFQQRMLWKESLGNNDKGWKCPHLTLTFVDGQGLKTIALHFNSWVWALIYHSICHQKKVPFICNIWQKVKQCWCKKWLWILQCIFEGNFMLSF